MQAKLLLFAILLAQSPYFSFSDPAGACPDKNERVVTFLVDTDDCSVFYKCESGVAQKYNCPEGLHFNPNIKVCDWIERTHCSNTGENGNNNNEIDNVNGNQENNALVGECPEDDGEYVTILADQSDCSKFYICNEGTPVSTPCPDGLLFNSELLVCDYPESAVCANGSNSNSNSGIDNNGGNSGSEVNGNEEDDVDGEGNANNNQDNLAPVGECPEEDGEYVTILADQSDCSKFYICNEGTPVSTSCPDGLLFNSEVLVCDYPESAVCADGSNSNSNNGIDNNGSNSGSEVNGNEEDDVDGEGNANNNQNNLAPVGECPEEDGEYVTILADQSDCSKFYICNEGTPVSTPCPDGLLFNSEVLVCDYPESAVCADGSNSNSNNGIDNNGSNSGSEVNGNEKDDVDGEGNANNNQDNLVPVGECPEEDGEYVTILADQSDCSKFYICNEGTPVSTPCPDGLLFNSEVLVCDYPESAVCADGSNSNSNNGIDNNGSNSGSEVNGNEEDDVDGEGNANNNQNNLAPVGECPEEDGEYVTILADQSDCSKFYICNEGTPVSTPCPDGLLFNSEVLVCDYPESAVCADGSNSNSNNGIDNNGSNSGSEVNGNEEDDVDGEGNANNNQDNLAPVGECPEEDGEYVTILADQSDCSKFYICNEGTPVSTPCPDGLLFNSEVLVCDYPESAVCADGSNSNSNNGIDNNGSNSGSEVNGNEKDDVDDEGNANNNQDNLAPVGECPEEDGEYVTILADQSDCSKFYICNEGTPVSTPCPDGLLFNSEVLVCDYPESAVCANGSNSNSNSGIDNNGGNSGSEVNGNEEDDVDGEGNANNNQDNLAPVGECPEEDGEYVTILADQSDCSKFYICNEGTPVSTPCPDGLLFNSEVLVCDYPESAVCADGSNSNSNNGIDNGSNSGSEVNGNEKDDVDGEGNANNNQDNLAPVGECPEEDGEYVTILADQSDCSKFYICNEGTPVSTPCPDGLLFNSEVLVCDYPESAVCADGSNSNSNNGIDNNGSNSGSEVNGNEKDDVDGEGNANNNQDNLAPVGECPEEDGEYVTILADQSDCSKFYICNEGTPVSTPCPDGLLFNSEVLVCDYPESAVCADGSNSNSNNGIDNNGSNSGSEVNGNEKDDVDGEGNANNNQDNLAPAGECPEEDGEYVTILPNQSDCSKFYICNEGIPVLAECPAGLLFNSELLVCDYAESAVCQMGSIKF